MLQKFFVLLMIINIAIVASAEGWVSGKLKSSFASHGSYIEIVENNGNKHLLLCFDSEQSRKGDQKNTIECDDLVFFPISILEIDSKLCMKLGKCPMVKV